MARRSRRAELVLSRLERGACGRHLVLPRPLERQLEGLGGIALLSRRDVEGLTRPVQLLRRDQLLGEQLLCAAVIALGQVTRGPRAVGALPQLLDLGWTGSGDEIVECRLSAPDIGLGLGDAGLGRAQRGFLPGGFRSLLGVVEAREHLPGRDRVSLVDEHGDEAARDLAADLDRDLCLYRSYPLDRGRDVALIDGDDSHADWAKQEDAGRHHGGDEQGGEQDPLCGSEPATPGLRARGGHAVSAVEALGTARRRDRDSAELDALRRWAGRALPCRRARVMCFPERAWSATAAGRRCFRPA